MELEAVDFATALKAYLEVGILGLAAIVLVLTFIFLIRKLVAKNDDKSKSLEENVKTINAQYTKLIESQSKQNEYIISQVVGQIVNHTPDPQETRKLDEIQNTINELIQLLRDTLKADRVSIVQFHNGGRGLNKQSFLKMSMTNEDTRPGVASLMLLCKDQFKSMFPYCTKILQEEGAYYLDSIEEIKDKDSSMYEFLQMNGILSRYTVALRHTEGWVLRIY